MTGLRYVYAVCRPFGAALQAQLTGVAGAPPKLLSHHGLIAVLSEVPERDFAEGPLKAHLEDLDWLTDTARAHQGVIDALTAVTTPLPLRLATVFRDDSGVRVMMETREEAFGRTLDRLEGRVEWGVKVYLDAETDHPPDRSQEDMWEKAETSARRLHETLSVRAEDFRLHAPQNLTLSNLTLSGSAGRNVLNAAYLVPRGKSEEFVEAVDRTKDDVPGLRVELTGPWAAYSFTGEMGETQRSEGPEEEDA